MAENFELEEGGAPSPSQRDGDLLPYTHLMCRSALHGLDIQLVTYLKNNPYFLHIIVYTYLSLVIYLSVA